MSRIDIAKKAASINAKALGVKMPRIVREKAIGFETETTRAALSEDGAVLAINDDIKMSEQDIWLAVSHEMRHVWQIETGYLRRAEYKAASETGSEEYNMQPEEIDAHAWALLAMANIYGVVPRYEDVVGKEISERITERAREITTEINGRGK